MSSFFSCFAKKTKPHDINGRTRPQVNSMMNGQNEEPDKISNMSVSQTSNMNGLHRPDQRDGPPGAKD